MSNWINALPVGWMALIVFGGVFLVTAGIYRVVLHLATDERARGFKGVSAGMLSPLGVIFGLFVAFLAAQVWRDVDAANIAVNREASALRGVVLLSRVFPAEADARLRGLVARHIAEAQDVEWPAMARHQATLTMVSASLAGALAAAVALPTTTPGEVAAQREIIAQLGNAFDARRQRILVSGGSVGWVKWMALVVQAVCTLVAIALVHCDNRLSAKLALGLFSTAVAACIVLITAYHKPFTGSLAVRPSALLLVQPDSAPVRPAP